MSDILDRVKAALADRYKIERELGSGGMATVYLAEDLKHERKVAVKVLRPDLAAALGPDRFLREIKIAAQLHHPHILPLHDSGEADGFLYYVMPYEEGQSLREKLAREGELPVADAVRLLRDVVDALAHAHGHGVVHRDIKPDNVMLSGRHALVTDFGVAKAVTEATGRQQLTTAGVALGTPAYMAPEQAVADPHIDHRADIYAVGVLAYELLTGRPPFSGRTAQEVLSAQVTEAPEPVTKYRDTVPPALAQLVMRCLEKKPADRWQSAEEMRSELETLATPSGGTAPTTAQPTAARVASPGLKKAGVVAAAVGVLALAGWFVLPRGASVPIDPDLVAVLPFRVTGGSADVADLREGMVDLMATYFTGEGGTMQSVDPGTVINQWRQRVDSDADDLVETDAVQLARDLGAGRLLTGSVVGTESQLVIRGVLSQIDGGERIQTSVEGPADSLLNLLPQFVGQLLAQSAGLAVDQSEALTTSLPALRAFLRGQVAYRGGNYRDAVSRFSEALETDSNFALAGVGLLSANGWSGSAGQRFVPMAERAAWQNRDALGPKDRAMVVAVMGPRGPDPDDGISTLLARERATRIAGDRAEAWYLLGDAYFHWGFLLGMDDPLDRAEEAFGRAISRDSLEAGVIQHLIFAAAYRGDTAQVRRWAALHARAVLDPAVGLTQQWFAGVVLGDHDLRDAALALLDSGGIGAGASIAYWVPGMVDHTAALEDLLARADRRAVGQGARDRIATERAHVALDRGRPAEAARFMAQRSRGAEVASILGAVFWGGDSTMAAAAAESLVDDPERGDGAWFELGASNSCALALWRLAHDQLDDLDRSVDQLRESFPGRDRDPSWPKTGNQICADAVEAALAQRIGRANARELIERLDETLKTRPYRSIRWENVFLSGLWEREGEYARAAAAARRHVVMWGYVSYYATILRESGRLSELAGDRERAIEAYSKYLDLRSDAEPSVQPEVEEVRRELARLVAAR